MLNEKEALRAAEYLRKWCKGHACGECIFHGGNCAVGYTTPANWVLPNPRRWSDADIKLAESLMAFGYEVVVKEPDTGDYTIWAKCANHTYDMALKPYMFGDIGKNETVFLRDVVKEKV